MTLRCAILDDTSGRSLSLGDWASLGDRVRVRAIGRHLEGDALVAEVADCAVLVVIRERTPLDAATLARLPALGLVVTPGMKNAAIDLAAAARQGVVVCGTSSGSAPPAELTWALILGLCREVVAENDALRAGGPWQTTMGADLAGARLGVVGLGRIGQRVARVGAAFDMDVVAWSPNLTPEAAAAGGARWVGKDELLATSDVVTLHLRLGARSRGVVGAAELRRMKPTALLINTSRAALVDHDALLRALREGWIRGAGVDVFHQEPLAPDDPMRALPRLLATPHLGYVTEANYRGWFAQVIEDIAAWLDGAPRRVLNG